MLLYLPGPLDRCSGAPDIASLGLGNTYMKQECLQSITRPSCIQPNAPPAYILCDRNRCLVCAFRSNLHSLTSFLFQGLRTSRVGHLEIAQAEAPHLARVHWRSDPGLRKLYFYAFIICIASATTGYDG
jgi:hypothetical protein